MARMWRRRHPAVVRSLGFAFAFVGVVVAWRTPGLMDALQRHPWLLPIEIVSVVVTGVPSDHLAFERR